VKFIDERKGHRVGDSLRWGVESIPTVLSEHGAAIAPSTYYDALVAPERPGSPR
jgi:putative transposase